MPGEKRRTEGHTTTRNDEMRRLSLSLFLFSLFAHVARQLLQLLSSPPPLLLLCITEMPHCVPLVTWMPLPSSIPVGHKVTASSRRRQETMYPLPAHTDREDSSTECMHSQLSFLGEAALAYKLKGMQPKRRKLSLIVCLALAIFLLTREA
jgi:hypothetical protein